ncbi:MAG: D-alanyl-D-alanine carboxypeptidase/D-alanyl-D-alanine-endopeptidase, partial [Polyangiaceae bacterium]|nr:D-alanyl-D-alanine carboxypeptidase/D-alanyl-D-alanine-endopeptidase [Polyangiaceae bacterium]
MKFGRFAFALSTLLLFPLGARAQSPTATVQVPVQSLVAENDHVSQIETEVQKLLDDRHLKDAQIGVAVMDTVTGHLLAAANEHKMMNPASNAKLFTAAAALALLRGEHKFETSLLGSIKDGEIVGPLVVRGTGDPSLVTADLIAMVQELKRSGVKRVSGDIAIDQRAFDAETTPPAFEQQPNEWATFRANVAAVSVNENTFSVTIKPTSAGQGAHVTFDPPGFVDQDGSVSTSAPGPETVTLALAPNGKRLAAKVGGSVGEDTKVVRYIRRVDDPTLLVGYVLRSVLEREGIKVQGEIKEYNAAGTAKLSLLAKHTSPPLSQLLLELGKASNNFYAEMVFKALGGEKKGRPAKSKAGAEVVSDWLKTIGAWETGTVIKNGSGLFDANRVSALETVAMLRYAVNDVSIASEYQAQLAIGGVDGTLRSRFRNEKKRRAVRAKTGTLDDT